MKNKLSIIVPIYNIDENLLSSFFESLNSQSSTCYDLIIVDDGSEENNKQIIEKYINKNTKIIYNEHHGVSFTRNTGILNTKTEYITFMDADDIIDKDFVKTANEYIEEYSPDIIYGTIEYVPNNNSTKQSNGIVEVYENEQIETIKKSLLNVGTNQFRVLGAPVARIYKTELAKKVLFDENVSMYEDQLFNRRIIDIAKKIVVVPDVWYYYVQHDNSSLHKNFSNNFYNSLVPYLKHSYQLDTKENNTIRNGMRLNYLKILYASINKDLLDNKYNNKEIKEKLLEMINNETIDDAIRNIDINDRNIRLIDKINILLLREKIISPLLLQKKILKFIRNNI